MSSSHIKRKSLRNGVEIHVRGIVQGVGFRPFIFKLASRFGVRGTVTNTSEGVLINAISRDDKIFSFIEAISEEAPPLAEIINLSYRPLQSPLQAESFRILASQVSNSSRAIIPPDIALCEDCLKELVTQQDRRFRYPFINCTNCGPRFSIVESIPYDRAKTSMKVFPMCGLCSREYEDPEDRRFHAQPNACGECGPHISWHDKNGKKLPCEDVIVQAVHALADGKVLAIRGLGGFHLCVDGSSESAVTRLRERKNRPAKPLAVMMADLETVRHFCLLSDEEADLLTSPEHPIVLLSPLENTAFASNLAPGMSDLGVMLPYTPLHHLLFNEQNCPDVLVMTSGNNSGEPICTSNEDALDRLGTIADFFLLHNRDIVTRVDDSVVKNIGAVPRVFRRSRGYVPAPVLVPYDLPEIIGCGGGLKSTFSLARGNTIFPSQHIGDLFNLASYDFYTESVSNLKRLLQIEPTAVCCDLHPDYLSSRFARDLSLPLYEAQHHHAHAVAVMAEHGLSQPTLAVVMDGTGYGSDGSIWGGEILAAELSAFKRLAALEPIPLPGGDTAATEPWRMALSHLFRLFGPRAAESNLLKSIDPARKRVIIQMLEKGFNSPLTTSCGRLFDTLAALLGINMVMSYEGEAAMLLEACARKALSTDWKDRLILSLSEAASFLRQENEQRWEIISSEFVKKVVIDLSSGADRSEVALRFHIWLIGCISRLVEKLSGSTGISDIVLSGGCMQNGLLLEGLLFTLNELGLTVYTGARIPMNDGGISVGQAVIGGLQHVSCSTDES